MQNQRYFIANTRLPYASRKREKAALSHQNQSHVISYVDGIELVGQKAVAKVHALPLAARIDGNDAGIDDHDNANNQLLLLQNGRSNNGDDVESLALFGRQFDDDDEEFRPGKNSASVQEKGLKTDTYK